MKEPILLLSPHVLRLPHHLTYTWLLMILFLVLGLLIRGRLQLVPGKFQVMLEAVVEGIYNFFYDILGPDTRRFYPLLATLGIYIFICNVMSLIPLFDSPTNVLNTTLAMAILVFIYYNYVGFKKFGIKYLTHFLGPIWWLSPLFTIVELISHFSRMLSLSVRLFGNIRGKDILLMVLFALVVMSHGILFLIPLPIFLLGLFVSLIQALIFALLSAMYLALAIEEEEY